MVERYQVREAGGLLDFLLAHLRGWGRNTVKQRLRAGCVSVNGGVVARHDHALKAGDRVEVSDASLPGGGGAPPTLRILHEDRELIAIDKPAGLLSGGAAGETRRHALAMVRDRLRGDRGRGADVCPVHRIDRETSGVLLFATSREMREAVMARWDEAKKTYLAVVEGRPDPAEGVIDEPLRRDETEYRMHVGEHPDARPAVTRYRTEGAANGRALLRVGLETGRQHQIRAHLAWLGCPVVGDPRYGVAGPRLGLHAWRLRIVHPVSGREMVFEAPIPADFRALMGPGGAEGLPVGAGFDIVSAWGARRGREEDV